MRTLNACFFDGIFMGQLFGEYRLIKTIIQILMTIKTNRGKQIIYEEDYILDKKIICRQKAQVLFILWNMPLL